ncbi:MAG: hypothetical protein IPF99_28760 [Deltaproteobacteria bacterium]|nr:hypothetical protein [Deltaproteobacteria bacterium]
MIPLSIRAVGMVSSVGNSALECSASVRAGVARIATTAVLSRRGSPLRLGLVPPEALHELPVVDAALRTTRHRRILRLAHAAIVEASDAWGVTPLPLSLVTSDLDQQTGPLLDDLAVLVGDRVDRATSRHFPSGSAGVFLALLDARHRIARGEIAAALVVGADSLLDLRRLDALQQAGRLLVDGVMNGFIPGEGAAALVVTAAGPGALATVAGLGAGSDGFRLDGEGPLTGDGLTTAVQTALADATAPVREVWADLNGESWSGREWGLAARRSHRWMAPEAAVVHPAEYFGDPGAASGAMLLTLAAVGLYRGISRGPSLVWGLAETGSGGAARLEPA